MRQFILTNVSVQGGVVNPSIYGLFDCPGKAMTLPAYYAEGILRGEVCHGVMVAIYG